MQKTLTLLLTAALLYMIFKHNLGEIKAPVTPSTSQTTTSEHTNSHSADVQPEGSFVEKTISHVLINVLKTDEGKMFFENILKPKNSAIAGLEQGFKINNDNLIESMFEIKTFGDGTNGPATCGHIVTVNYKILAPNNMLIREGTTTYPLGTNQIGPGVDATIVGMKTGQTRHAIISSKYTDIQAQANEKPEIFKLNVQLKEITPQNFIDKDVKIFDDELAYKLPLLCGNKAIYNARITKLYDGSVIYDSTKSGKKLNMQIGTLTYPVIFSYALHNKIPIGTRTVIAKGNLFKSFANDFSTIFPTTKLPENEFFMLELFDFEDNKTASSGGIAVGR